MNYIFSLAELLPRSELVIMGRVKGLHPGSSKDMVQCPVDGCIKVKVRRDNWIKHMKNQVIVGKKYNIKTVKCQVCGYPSNFKNNKTCRECQAPLEGESINAVYLDTERAEGRANSDPIQLGLVKYCLQCWSRSWHLDQQITIKHLDGSED